MPQRARLVVWAEPGQEQLITDAVDAASLELVAVGAPTAPGAATLGGHFDVDRFADLRLAAQRDDVDVLWLASPRVVEADARRLLRESPIQTVSSEPRPMTLADLRRDPDESTTADFVPLMRRSPGFRAALDAVRESGPPQAMSVFVGAGVGEGTLFARLFDAMDLVVSLCGPAEGIDATLATPPGQAAGHATGQTPEMLADLHGHMTVNLRYADNRCVCIAATDRAGSWFRHATIVGGGVSEASLLHVTDLGYEHRGSETPTPERGGVREPVAAGTLVGDQIRRLLDDLDAADEPPPDHTTLFALCEAARLSCRTGQGETPRRLLEMRL